LHWRKIPDPPLKKGTARMWGHLKEKLSMGKLENIENQPNKGGKKREIMENLELPNSGEKGVHLPSSGGKSVGGGRRRQCKHRIRKKHF